MTIDYSNQRFFGISKVMLSTLSHLVDKKEAPEGYYPVPKDDVQPNSFSVTSSSRQKQDNICNYCEWRKECCALVKDSKYVSCMSYNRKDGIGVVFKKAS
jgi:hypothetical protein